MKTITAQFRHYLSICLEGLRKPRRTSVSIAGLQAEIGTKNPQDASLEHYRRASPPDFDISFHKAIFQTSI
jgi:hypothetical protein